MPPCSVLSDPNLTPVATLTIVEPEPLPEDFNPLVPSTRLASPCTLLLREHKVEVESLRVGEELVVSALLGDGAVL